MSLVFSASLEGRGFDLQVEIGDGERVAVLGHNGSGKSTFLGILAGTIRPDAGYASYNGRVLFDLSSKKRYWTAPHARGVSLLAQDPLLFPHMTVQHNVMFGPQNRGKGRSQSRAIAARWMDEVDVSEFAERKPSQLSGGQAQRVAIARALAAEPDLLLLDEPMAALDVAVAPVLRRLLRRVLEGRSTLMVTHDLLDAMLFSERAIVLEDGELAESGPTREVLQRPRTKFTAGLAGLNLIRGLFSKGHVDAGMGMSIRGSMGSMPPPPDGSAVAAVFAPSSVSIFLQHPGGSPRNGIEVVIKEIEPRQDLVRIRGTAKNGIDLSADVTVQSVAELDLYPGRSVIYALKAAAVTVYEI